MTDAERMQDIEALAVRLETRARIRRSIPRSEPDRISTDCELAAKYLREEMAYGLRMQSAYSIAHNQAMANGSDSRQ